MSLEKVEELERRIQEVRELLTKMSALVVASAQVVGEPPKDWTTPEPPPRATDTQEVWPLVIDDFNPLAPHYSEDLAEAFRQRHQYGRKKYAVGLQVENGRNPLRDLLDEALDAVAYSRQQAEHSHHPDDFELHELAICFAAMVMARFQGTS